VGRDLCNLQNCDYLAVLHDTALRLTAPAKSVHGG
jgi:hypothetical protein